MKSKTYGSRSRQIKNKLIQLVNFVESLEELNKTNTKAPCTNRFDNLIKMTKGPPQRFQLLKRKVQVNRVLDATNQTPSAPHGDTSVPKG